jgi:hypothetical protein
MTFQDRIIKINNTSNFNNLTSIEYIELNIHATLIVKMLNNGTLINRLEETNQSKFKRNEHCKLGLHSMRRNTVLDGLENYFTTDIKNDKKNLPGICRALWSCKINSKGGIKSVKYIGIVNTHKSEANLIPLSEVNPKELNKYIHVIVTDRITKIPSIICVLKYTLFDRKCLKIQN